MLDDRQRRAVDMYVRGHKITEIANDTGVSRQAVYDWLKKEEFKAEVDRCLTLLKSEATNTIISNVKAYITELEGIALTSGSDKTKSDALMYLIDHVIGKPTTKIEDVTTNTDNGNKSLSWDDVKSLDNNTIDNK